MCQKYHIIWNTKCIIPRFSYIFTRYYYKIKKLERLYKSGKYSHKRIWQVAMIMKVRLEQLRSKKPKQYSLSKRYYDFLKKRTKTKKESDRKKMLFKV